jgi:Glycine zipper 2TM domain
MAGPYDSQYQYQSYGNNGVGYSHQNTAYTGYEQYSTYPSQGFAPQAYNSNTPFYSQPQSNSYYSPSFDPSNPHSQPHNGAQGDKGLLGALGGGAAGGFAGHKMGHGFLGTIGGAIVGSLTEDYAKSKHKKSKNHQKYNNYTSQAGRRNGGSHSSVSGGGFGSGWSTSTSNGGGLGALANTFFGSQKR